MAVLAIEKLLLGYPQVLLHLAHCPMVSKYICEFDSTVIGKSLWLKRSISE